MSIKMQQGTRAIEQHLLSAVEHISIERGFSPRRSRSPLQEALARCMRQRAGLPARHVPSGALCAIGMLHADVRQDSLIFGFFGRANP